MAHDAVARPRTTLGKHVRAAAARDIRQIIAMISPAAAVGLLRRCCAPRASMATEERGAARRTALMSETET